MIKALQILLVKGCIALLIAAYAVCVVGGDGGPTGVDSLRLENGAKSGTPGHGE